MGNPITTTNLPQAGLPVLNPDGTFQQYWYRFFQQGGAGGGVDPAVITAIESQLSVIDGEIAAIQAELANVSTAKSFDINLYLDATDLTYDAAYSRCITAHSAAYFPNTPKLGGGVYLFNNTLPLKNGQALIGDSQALSVIACQTAAAPTVTLGSQIYNFQISDLSITHSVTSVSGGHGITQGQGLTDWVNGGIIENVSIINNWIGANLGKCFLCHVIDSDCSDNLAGAWVMTSAGITTVPSGTANGPLQWYFNNCSAGGNGGDAFSYTCSATSGAVTLSVGTLTSCTTFANAGHGVAAYGNSHGGISSIRVNGGFFGNDQLHEIYLDSYSNRHSIKPDYIELAGQGFTLDPTNPACGVYVTANGTSGNQNTDTIIQIGQINGCAGDGIFIEAPDCQVLGGIITNNGLGGVTGRQNGIYCYNVTAQIVGVLAKDTGAGVQQFGISCNLAGMQVTGCTLLGNLTGPVGFPTFVGDTTTTIVGCLPTTINQVWADQLHVYGASAFLGAGGAAGTLGINILAGGIAMTTGVVGNGIATDNIYMRVSGAVGTPALGVAGQFLVAGNLSTVGTATTDLTASGGIAMSGGITVVSGGMNFLNTGTNGINAVDDLTVRRSFAVDSSASGVAGRIDIGAGGGIIIGAPTGGFIANTINLTGNYDINGNPTGFTGTYTGNVTFTGNLTVTGETQTQDLYVTRSIGFTTTPDGVGGHFAGSPIAFTGASINMTGALAVTGATSISGGLSMIGSDISMGGHNITSANAITATGQIQAQDLYATRSGGIALTPSGTSGQFGVNSAIIIGMPTGSYQAGSVNVPTSYLVNNVAAVGFTGTYTGNVTFTGNLTVTGQTQTQDLYVTRSIGFTTTPDGTTGHFAGSPIAFTGASINMTGALAVTGASTLTGGASLGSDLGMGGHNITSAGTGAFSGAVSVGSLSSGAITGTSISASVDLATTGTATAHLTASGGIAMSGGITVLSGGIAITGGINVDNIAMTGGMYNPAATGTLIGAGTINLHGLAGASANTYYTNGTPITIP